MRSRPRSAPTEHGAARERAQRATLAWYIRPDYHGEWCGEDEKALLGKLPDAEVARRTGRTVEAVRIKRTPAGLPTAREGRRHKAQKKGGAAS